MGTACSAENRDKLQKKALSLVPSKKPEASADGTEKEPLQDATGAAKEAVKDAEKTDDSNPLAALGIDTSGLGEAAEHLVKEEVVTLLSEMQSMFAAAETTTEAGDAGETAEKVAGETTDSANKKEGGVDLKSVLGNKNLQEALKGVNLEDPEKLKEILNNDDVKKVVGGLKGVDCGEAVKKVQQLFSKLPDNITSLIPSSSGDKPAGASDNATANKAADLVNQGKEALGKLTTGGDKK